MKIFIDTANLNEIKQAFSWGIIDGVTTNPSLIKKAVKELNNISMENYLRELLKTVGKDCPVSLEVIGLTEKEMFNQAMTLYNKFNKVASNVVIKIPVNPSPKQESGTDYDGLKVISRLAEQGVPVNATLIMTPEQALLAAKAGAKYVSPFAGRIDDLIRTNAKIIFTKIDYYPAEGTEHKGKTLSDNGIVSGVHLVTSIAKIFKNYNIKTEIIAASLRNPRQVREVAEAGAHISTIPFNVIKEMVTHTKTYEGIRKFSDDIVLEYEEVFK